MPQPATYPRTSWFFKFCECLLASAYALTVITIPLELLPRAFMDRYGEYILPVIGGLALLGTLFYTWRWHQRDHPGYRQSGRAHAWLQGIIRYWLAFVISLYGFGKLLKTQLQPTVYDFDTSLGDASGFRLTWFYFGYSYPLVVIVGLLQLGGAMLLLYRRTRLLGVMVLLPVMVNIVLINLFYAIDPGAFITSIAITIGLIFLLLLDIKKLKAAFWELVDHLPTVRIGRHWVKHVLRLIPLAAAFAVVYSFVSTNEPNQLLKGTWKVDALRRNGQLVQNTAWLTDTMAWNRVYFTGRKDCAFSPNPYRYRPAESWRGTYAFDSLTNGLQIVFSQPDKRTDTLRATISHRAAASMQLLGTLRGDTLAMQLARLR